MATSAATPLGMRDYVGALRRRLIYVVTIAPVVLLVAVFLAYWLTPKYQGTATILLQASTVTKDVVDSTVTSNTDQQIQLAQEQVMTVDAVAPLVRDLNPYPQDGSAAVTQQAQRILSDTSVEMVDPVSFKPTSDPSNAFELHYTNADPRLAAAITQRLTQLFLTFHQEQRAEGARETAVFLQQQAAGVTKQMAEVDGELARLKTNVGDALPELRDQNQDVLERTSHNIDALQQEILAAEDKESQLSVQLGQISPNLITQSGDLTDVATVRAKLAEAEQRYTPEHPEVKRLKRALEVLMAANAGRSQTNIAASANNPQYLMIATQLQSARKELASLRGQAAKEQDRLTQYEELLRRTPTVERQESDILRRRQSLQTQYQQIQDKLQTAQEAQSFEAQRRGDHFVVLKAAEVPSHPVSPNRPGFIALGLLLGLGLAGAVVAFVETTDVHIRNIADLPSADEAPLLATIPLILNARDRFHKRALLTAFGLAYTLAVVAVGTVVAAAMHHHP